jgi:hypothetical protein
MRTVMAMAMAVVVLVAMGVAACSNPTPLAAQNPIRCPSSDSLSCYSVHSNRPVHGPRSVSYQGQTVQVVGHLPVQCNNTYQGCELETTIPNDHGHGYFLWDTSTNGDGHRFVATYDPGAVSGLGPSAPFSDGSQSATVSSCSSEIVTARAQFGVDLAGVCVRVGTVMVVSGGQGGSNGTWPGPPSISNSEVLSLLSNNPTGSTFTDIVQAKAVGSATVRLAFVAGPDVCAPTPCTPIPGAPFLLDVTVVP